MHLVKEGKPSEGASINTLTETKAQINAVPKTYTMAPPLFAQSPHNDAQDK